VDTLYRDFEHARKAWRIEHELSITELANECALDQVRSEALLSWRIHLWPTVLLPNQLE
jgi:hypothetical protein